MSRSTTLAIVHPVDKLQGSDDAVRTQVWEETTHLLTPKLYRIVVRFLLLIYVLDISVIF